MFYADPGTTCKGGGLIHSICAPTTGCMTTCLTSTDMPIQKWVLSQTEGGKSRTRGLRGLVIGGGRRDGCAGVRDFRGGARDVCGRDVCGRDVCGGRWDIRGGAGNVGGGCSD